MYLAGLMANPNKQMSPAEVQAWAEQANWSMLSEYTIPCVAAELVMAGKWD